MANLWGRFMAGLTAFTYAFNERDLIPSERFEWNDYRARLLRYALAEAFYNNTVYRDIERFNVTIKHEYQLYKHIRGIYNPVYRQNELIKSKVAGGALDWEALEKGALVVVGADPALRTALIRALKWSNWGVNKGLYVQQCALLGDSILKVVDDRRRQKVRIEILHPAKLKEATFDDVGNIKRAVIEYQREWLNPDTQQLQDVLYTEILDQDETVTFKDGEEFAWAVDMGGIPTSRWANDYGFVPLVKAGFKDVGQLWDANAFHAETAKIHEINDAASILNDAIRRQHNTPMLLAGVPKPATTPKIPGTLADRTSTNDASAARDNEPYLYADKEASAHSLIIPIDISAGSANTDAMLKELERDMPELALHRLRESGGDKPGIAIRNMYSDATGRLTEAASNMDDGLIRALQMTVSIGGLRQYDDFAGFDLQSFERGDLDFYIRERAFFEDGFTKQERVTNLKSLPDKPEAARAVLEEMEYPEDKIELIVAEIALAQQQAAMQPAGENGNGAISVQPNPRPQLPTGQPQNMQNSNVPGGIMTPEVVQQVRELMASMGVAA